MAISHNKLKQIHNFQLTESSVPKMPVFNHLYNFQNSLKNVSNYFIFSHAFYILKRKHFIIVLICSKRKVNQNSQIEHFFIFFYFVNVSFSEFIFHFFSLVQIIANRQIKVHNLEYHHIFIVFSINFKVEERKMT
jgi:hypothetical protein